MQFLRLPSKCGGCGLPSRQRPRASSARLSFATRRSYGLLPSGDPQMAGWTRPQPSRSSRHDSPALRPAVAKFVREVSEWFAETVCRLWYAPRRRRNQRHGARCLGAVHLPARCDTIAAWHVGRGVPRPGRVSPTDAWIAPERARLPGLRVSPVMAAALRSTPNCFDAPRTCPGLPGGPGECRHTTAPTWESQYTHHQRITSAARLAALAAKGSAPHLAPRHYRIAATTFGILRPRLRRSVTINGSDGGPRDYPKGPRAAPLATAWLRGPGGDGRELRKCVTRLRHTLPQATTSAHRSFSPRCPSSPSSPSSSPP